VLLKVVTGIAAFVAIPACCCAGPAPDSARMAALHAAAAEWNAYRIVTRRTRIDLHELRADAGGILLREAQKRPAVVTLPGYVDEPRRIPWAEIERIDGKRTRFSANRTVEGMVIGGLVGVGAAFGVASRVGDHVGDSAAGLAIFGLIPSGILVGGAIGATVGTSTKWTPLYP